MKINNNIRKVIKSNDTNIVESFIYLNNIYNSTSLFMCRGSGKKRNNNNNNSN